LLHLGRSQQRPRQRVFPTTITNNENIQGFGSFTFYLPKWMPAKIDRTTAKSILLFLP
jgi:hypothetical protein